MIFAGLGWVAMVSLVRELSADYSPFQLLFFRNVVAVCLLLPLALKRGAATLRTNRLPLHTLRSAFSYCAVLALYFGIATVPLPEATALSFTQPLFGTVLAVLVLHEVVGLARWRAVAIGFAGILIILRPGFADVTLGTLAVLGSAILYACANICVKRLMTTDTPQQAVFYFNLIMLPIALVPALFFWVAPTAGDFALMIGVGLAGTAAVWGYVKAFDEADVSAVAPFDFLRLPMASLAALILFDDAGDLWTWIGSAVVFGSAIILARSEGRKS